MASTYDTVVFISNDKLKVVIDTKRDFKTDAGRLVSKFVDHSDSGSGDRLAMTGLCTMKSVHSMIYKTVHQPPDEEKFNVWLSIQGISDRKSDYTPSGTPVEASAVSPTAPTGDLNVYFKLVGDKFRRVFDRILQNYCSDANTTATYRPMVVIETDCTDSGLTWDSISQSGYEKSTESTSYIENIYNQLGQPLQALSVNVKTFANFDDLKEKVEDHLRLPWIRVHTKNNLIVVELEAYSLNDNSDLIYVHPEAAAIIHLMLTDQNFDIKDYMK